MLAHPQMPVPSTTASRSTRSWRLHVATPPTRRARYVALVVSALLAVSGCGGGSGDGVAQPVVVPKGFSVSLSAGTASINAGANASLTASIARTGSFDGTVNLTAENLPAGVTVTFSPASITTATTSSTVSVVVASSAAPGSYPLTLRGSSAGLADQTATVTLTVLPAPAFALTLTPAAVTVQAGTTGQVVAQIARTNFSGSIALTVDGAPAGVGVQVATPSLAADTSSLLVTVSTTTTPGTYTMSARAQSSLADRTTPLTLIVTAPADFTLSASASSVAIVQGQTSPAVALTIARTGGFNGAVALNATGLPVGVTANFASSNVTGSGTTVTFTASATASVGTSNVVIRSTATGLSERSVALALTVTPSLGGFSLTVSQSTLAVPQASSATVTITIARVAPFVGPVSLSLTGSASGIAASLSTTTIAAGATTATLSVAAAILAPLTAPSPFVVHATSSGVSSQDVTITIGAAASPAALVAQHVLVQQGLGLALSFSVLQMQLQVVLQATTHGLGSAKPCTVMVGGGSVQSLPIGADNPTKSGFYYDNVCTKPYILNDITSFSEAPNHQVEIAGTANYFTLAGAPLGVLTMQQSAQVSAGVEDFLAGVGTFTPATGAAPIKMGLACTLQAQGQTAIPCTGGVLQNVPSLALAIGSVTPLTLHVTAFDAPMTFEGNTAVLTTGAINALTLTAPSHSALNISGGSVWGTSTQQGGTGTFSLFPALPAGWTIIDTAHDMKFGIDFTNAENSTGTVRQISTGTVLATVVVNGSGTGTVTWSDGAVATVTGWAIAN
jgi:hypothetical protein